MNHIFFCLDQNYIKYVPLVLKSFVKYHNLKLYQLNFIVYNIQEHKELKDIIKDISININYTIKNFVPPSILIEHLDKINHKRNIFNNISNWSRFYITDLYPNIEKGLYLDLDILFRSKIDDIFTINFKGELIASIPNKIRKHYINFRTDDLKNKFEKEFNMKYDNKLYNYNCGVIYYNLVKLKNLSQLINDILEFQINNDRITKKGTEPLHNILFNDYIPLHHKYNHIYKFNKNMNGIIIHFKGKRSYELMNKFIKHI